MWGDPYPAYSYYDHDGSLKLKVTPRQAEVYVDGYFAGAVDDYDGIFQQLRINPGPHRIEIRLDGYETLTFDVRIEPGRTITYKSEMRRRMMTIATTTIATRTTSPQSCELGMRRFTAGASTHTPALPPE
ncbi:MAG: PEGA domain-containing protein [Vicinamibacterales bacterium]